MEEYKQKYEEALERAKVLNPGTADYEVAVKIFPELKESEDEGIRKWLIKAMKHLSEESTFFLEVPKDKVIAWLEKQGEQKPVDKIEQESTWNEEDESMLTRCIGILGKCYMKELPNKVEEELIWLKSIKSKIQPQPKQEWSEEDEKMWSTISDLLWEGFKLSDGKVSWDKIRCWLLPKITYFKDRVQTHPKQEWSEEDEKFFKTTLWHISHSISNSNCTNVRSNTADWLKSLKERMKGE